MPTQPNAKSSSGRSPQKGRSTNERSGENNRGSQNNSDHRKTKRDSDNPAGRNADQIREGNEKAAAATAKNSESANRIGHKNDSDKFEIKGNRKK